MTEKAMMKTSALGYASGLRRLYYSCPAVSQRERLMRVLSTLIVVVVLSKIVGTYSVGNLFCEYLRVYLGIRCKDASFTHHTVPDDHQFYRCGLVLVHRI
jgi:uncharacterized membrane protein YjdF